MRFERSVFRMLIGYRDKSRKAARVARLYPRVLALFVESRKRGVCPLCGRPIANSMGYAAHLGRGETCRVIVYNLIRMMLQEVPEDEVLDYINRVRALHGLPPLEVEAR